MEPAAEQHRPADPPANALSLDSPIVPNEDINASLEYDEITSGTYSNTVNASVLVHDTTSAKLSKHGEDEVGRLSTVNKGRGQSSVYTNNVYAAQPQALVYGGYEYPSHLNLSGLDASSNGLFSNSQPMLYGAGSIYSPQSGYGSLYSPVPPSPMSARDGQSYSTQQPHYIAPYYDQPSPSAMAYMGSQVGISQADTLLPVSYDGLLPDPWSSLYSSGLGYLHSYLPFNGASLQPSVLPSHGQHSTYQSFGKEYPYSPASFKTSVDRRNSFPGQHQQGSKFGYSAGFNRRGDAAEDSSKGSFASSYSGAPDFLNEQNRGPRASRPKKKDEGQTEPDQVKDNPSDHNSSTNNREAASLVEGGLYNSPDFITKFDDAMFFIIKSYTEDNVHKSIKYGVWASTTSGNRKLDAAYRCAKVKDGPCPIFLFFSVNGSGHFCGVAEMVGPVDFESSVDYWQQDKWAGQFPVKWHIIKDVPNNMLRHIVLANNENKPVTNSRDTQEVKLEQGLEVLSIFKNYASEDSILDDFDFYEQRERAMQEVRSRRHSQQPSFGAKAEVQEGAEGSQGPLAQISDAFAHVQLEADQPEAAEPTGNEISADASVSAAPQGVSEARILEDAGAASPEKTATAAPKESES